MRLCHPDDMILDLTAYGFVLKAECHAPKCRRAYGKFKMESFREEIEPLAHEHLRSDTWSTFSSVERMVNEMRCRHNTFCSSCQFGNDLEECKGTRHA